jgi:hypothetical protein
VPFGIAIGDAAGDGNADNGDTSTIPGWTSGSLYDVRAEFDIDGDVDWTDAGLFVNASMGHGALALVGNRFGYAGYIFLSEVAGAQHFARHRRLLSEQGRCATRDSLGAYHALSF